MMNTKTIEMIEAGRRARRTRSRTVIAALALITALLCGAMLYLGNTIYPVQVIWRVLTGGEIQGATFAIGTLRLPRMLAGLFTGFAFGMAGSVFQTMLNALVSYMLLKAASYDVASAMRWLSGSLNTIQMKDLPPLVIVVVVFCPLVLLLGRRLQVLELGEQSAVMLGLKANQTRVLLILSSVCLLAFATATTGPIASVAFLAGPIAKRLTGIGSSYELPSGFVGAVLVLGADLLGQFAFSVKFPVGVITGIIGAPYLIFLLIKANKTGGAR